MPLYFVSNAQKHNVRVRSTHDTDDCYLLVLPPIRDLLPGLLTRVEARAMVQLTLEVLQALDVRPVPPTERAGRVDEHVRDVLKLLGLTCRPIGAADANVPFSGKLVVAGASDLVRKLDVAHEFVLLNDALEVLPDLWTRSVEGRPVLLLLEGELVLQRQQNVRLLYESSRKMLTQ